MKASGCLQTPPKPPCTPFTLFTVDLVHDLATIGAVQLRLPWEPRAAARGSRSLTIDGCQLAVEVVRHRRARRYVVRVAPDGSVRLTVPRGSSIAGGLAFAAGQAPWITRERALQLERSAPWADGSFVWWRGERVLLRVSVRAAAFGAERVPLTARPDVRAAVEDRMRSVAAAELPGRCHALATACGVRVARVSVRNQRSRWGACSSRGVITLNWRLVQMPPAISDYVIFHELMHVRHPNHSRRFWRAVDQVCDWWRDAERWLRNHGRELLP